jgi:hypothetical protein
MEGNQHPNYSAAANAIATLFSNTTVSSKLTLLALQELCEEIEAKIDSLEVGDDGDDD